MKLCVLMSTFNGKKYIHEQLSSLKNQTIKIDEVLVRDDGSYQATLDKLEEEFNKKNITKLFLGQNMGVTKSFLKLIEKNPGYDYYALCDQDDVWLENKMEKAIEMLSKEDQSIPLLYISRFTLVDENLRPLKTKISKLYSYTDFPHSLMFHTGPGCTFVFNESARREIIKFDYKECQTILHDSLIHKLVAMKGRVLLDTNSYILYRQHSNNLIGYTSNIFKRFCETIKNFLFGRNKNYRSKSCQEILTLYKGEITEDNRQLLEEVANCNKSFMRRIALLREKRIKTNSLYDLLLYALIMLGLI